MKLKPFDLEAALQGAAVVTRDGREVNEVVYLKTRSGNLKVIAVIDGLINAYDTSGKYYTSLEEGHVHDLFMKPTQVTKWVNIYKHDDEYWSGNLLFDTKEQAEECRGNIVNTVQITVEA